MTQSTTHHVTVNVNIYITNRSVVTVKQLHEESVSIIGENVITSLSDHQKFDFGTNFCLDMQTEQVGDIEDYETIANFLQIMFYHLAGLTIITFLFLGGLSLIDANIIEFSASDIMTIIMSLVQFNKN